MTKAQAAEARRTTYEIDFEGHTYEIDPLRMTWETLEKDAGGDHAGMVRDLLGEEQWAAFTERHPNPMVLDDDGDFVSIATSMRVFILAGMSTLGNSGASSSS